MSEQEKQEVRETDSQVGADTFFSDTPRTAETPVKQGMSKNVRNLLIAAAALVIVGTALAVVILTGHSDEDNSSIDVSSLANQLLDDEEVNAVQLNPESGDDVREIQISNTEDFTVYQLKPASEDEKAVYTIRGYEDMNLDTGLISTLVNNASELSAIQLVEETPSDLAKYGLSDPLSRVKMSYQDGTDFEFSVGSVSPMDSSQTYCEVNGSVYLVKTSLMANYQKDSIQFVSKTILEKPDDDNYPIVKSVRIQREDLDYDIYLEYDYESAEDDSVGGTAATHVMREPIFSYLNVEHSTDVTNGMFGLTSLELVQIHPTETDLFTAGIDVPFCTVTMDCDDGNVYTLKFGDMYQTADGTDAYYAYLEGVDVLYGVAQTRAVWATMQPGDITSANIFGTMVWNIGTLDVTGGGQELHFVGEGDKDTYVVTKNGEPCDTERFRLLYKFFLYIYGEELYLDAELPDSPPDAEIHLTTQNGREDYTISFYKLEGLNGVVAVNGTPTYKIRSSCIDVIWHNLEIFDNLDEDFTMTWQ